MPRETIFTPYANDPNNGPPPFQLEVGWQRDADVQVGISTMDLGAGQLHLVDYIYGDVPTRTTIGRETWAKLRELAPQAFQPLDFRSSDQEAEFHLEVGRAVLDAVTGSTPFGTSVWWHPGRAQINRLITLLRKSRDAAFGADA